LSSLIVQYFIINFFDKLQQEGKRGRRGRKGAQGEAGAPGLDGRDAISLPDCDQIVRYFVKL